MKNVSEKGCRENQNIHFMFNNILNNFFFFFFENLSVHETMWKSFIEPDRPQMTIWRMRAANYVTKSTKTH